MDNGSFHADVPQNYDFSPEEEGDYIDITSGTSLKVVKFPRKSRMELWVGTGGEFPHLSRKALHIHLPSQHPACARLGFEQWQPSNHSIAP
jgi:hypothetical protein